MSISFKDVESRVTVLESISQRSNIRYELSNDKTKGCIYFGSLMFNFGNKGYTNTDTFFKPFPSKLLIILNCHNSDGTYASDARVVSSSLSGFTSNQGQKSNWLAIGY